MRKRERSDSCNFQVELILLIVAELSAAVCFKAQVVVIRDYLDRLKYSPFAPVKTSSFGLGAHCSHIKILQKCGKSVAFS